MFLRLLDLMRTLNDLKYVRVENKQNYGEVQIEKVEDDLSIFARAWNIIPTILPSIENANIEESQYGHFCQYGFYVDRFQFFLKSQEIVTDAIVHPLKKLKYIPILRIELFGVYFNAILNGRKWFNLEGGITYFGVYSMGRCDCNKQHKQQALLASKNVRGGLRNYLNDSLLDDKTAENLGNSKIYCNSWDDYYEQNTEFVLCNKTPGLSFDIVHAIELTEDVASSDIGSDLEFSNLSEKKLFRIFLGDVTIKYSIVCHHLIIRLNKFIAEYNYPTYMEPKTKITRDNLGPPISEDYEALMVDVPIDVLEIFINNFNLQLCIDEDVLNEENIDTLPSLNILIGRLDAKMISPKYPNRLINLTCQLPSPPKKLLEKCFTKYHLNCMNICATLEVYGNSNELLIFDNISFELLKLLENQLWQSSQSELVRSTIKIKSVTMQFNRAEYLLLDELIRSFYKMTFNKIVILLKSSICEDAIEDNMAYIKVDVNEIELFVIQTNEKFIGSFSIDRIHSMGYHSRINYSKQLIAQKTIHLFETDDITTDENSKQLGKSIVYAFLQLPIDIQSQDCPIILQLNVNTFIINFDPILYEYLAYDVLKLKSMPMRVQRKNIIFI